MKDSDYSYKNQKKETIKLIDSEIVDQAYSAFYEKAKQVLKRNIEADERILAMHEFVKQDLKRINGGK